jgi:hypothetical protein
LLFTSADRHPEKEAPGEKGEIDKKRENGQRLILFPVGNTLLKPACVIIKNAGI